jgi:phosphoribosylaminoimidazole-succinocarboxamide synthase
MTRTFLFEGKTKKFFSDVAYPGFVVIQNKDDITKNDDPAQTKIMPGKGKLAADTTCAVFQLLKDAGIPVAYEKRLNETEFLAPLADEMISLEVIARRFADGGFLKRHPEFITTSGVPYRFHRLAFELFLKTTNGKINRPGFEDFQVNVDDPFISNPYAKEWKLFHRKKPSWVPEADLKVSIPADKIRETALIVAKIEELTRKIFLVLEGAWGQLGFHLVDFKIEFCFLNGKIMLADVLDADSWRLRNADWTDEFSKQLFRNEEPMEKIKANYAEISRMVQQFRIPKQAVVVWRGSSNDQRPNFPEVPGVVFEDMVFSGQKAPQTCMEKLEGLLTKYPEGGVILGMSSGLDSILSARTSWPFINVVTTTGTFPNALWSSVCMPGGVPSMTMLSSENAVLAALDILGLKNPAAYAHRQLAIEKLDK